MWVHQEIFQGNLTSKGIWILENISNSLMASIGQLSTIHCCINSLRMHVWYLEESLEEKQLEKKTIINPAFFLTFFAFWIVNCVIPITFSAAVTIKYVYIGNEE